MKKLTAIVLIAMLVMVFAAPVFAAEVSPGRTIMVIPSIDEMPEATDDSPFFIYDADEGVMYAKFTSSDGTMSYVNEEELDGNVDYSVVKGGEATLKKYSSTDPENADKSYTIATDANTEDNKGKGDFVAVIIDGEIVDDSFYTISPDSAEITFTEAFMKTLTGGQHTFIIQYTDGSATSKFYVEDETPEDVMYVVVKGAEETWTKKSGEPFIVASDHVSNIGKEDKEPVVHHFTDLVIDGKTVDPSNYTYYEGSIEIKLTAEFMESLELGAHPFTINADDGSASAKFYVVTSEDTAKDSTEDTTKDTEAPKDTTPAPQTGDDSNTSMWTAIALIALGAIGVVALTLVKTRKSTEK